MTPTYDEYDNFENKIKYCTVEAVKKKIDEQREEEKKHGLLKIDMKIAGVG